MLVEEGLFFLLFGKSLGDLTLLGLLRYFKLGDELADSHHFVEFEVPGSHKLSTHNPVQHLVEVDESIINIDAHLEHNSVNYGVSGSIWDLHFESHTYRQLFEEGRDLFSLDLNTLVSHCHLNPRFTKGIKVLLEAL